MFVSEYFSCEKFRCDRHSHEQSQNTYRLSTDFIVLHLSSFYQNHKIKYSFTRFRWNWRLYSNQRDSCKQQFSICKEKLFRSNPLHHKKFPLYWCDSVCVGCIRRCSRTNWINVFFCWCNMESFQVEKMRNEIRFLKVV